jgi:anti-sigma regulatory factor (Ser/Thr protein kinase)
LKEEVTKQKRILGMMEQAIFHFRTLEEAKNLAYFIANCFPDPEATIYGLNELLTNAIEHGNLGITYAEKTKLVMEGAWRDEVERRLNLPDNHNKLAYLSFEHMRNTIKVTIKDQGSGFDWKKYLDISSERITDPHGRGIAMSKMMSFTSVDFIGKGNEVVCKVEVNDK